MKVFEVFILRQMKVKTTTKKMKQDKMKVWKSLLESKNSKGKACGYAMKHMLYVFANFIKSYVRFMYQKHLPSILGLSGIVNLIQNCVHLLPGFQPWHFSKYPLISSPGMVDSL